MDKKEETGSKIDMSPLSRRSFLAAASGVTLGVACNVFAGEAEKGKNEEKEQAKKLEGALFFDFAMDREILIGKSRMRGALFPLGKKPTKVEVRYIKFTKQKEGIVAKIEYSVWAFVPHAPKLDMWLLDQQGKIVAHELARGPKEEPMILGGKRAVETSHITIELPNVNQAVVDRFALRAS